MVAVQRSFSLITENSYDPIVTEFRMLKPTLLVGVVMSATHFQEEGADL